jgi:hypothetical protein
VAEEPFVEVAERREGLADAERECALAVREEHHPVQDLVVRSDGRALPRGQAGHFEEHTHVAP